MLELKGNRFFFIDNIIRYIVSHYVTIDQSHLMIFFYWIIKCNRRGLPPSNDDILNSAQNIIKAHPDRKHPFVNGRPGRKWFNVSSLLITYISDVNRDCLRF